jgi:hypothetical protein
MDFVKNDVTGISAKKATGVGAGKFTPIQIPRVT